MVTEDGRVLFAGPFEDYGHLVLVQSLKTGAKIAFGYIDKEISVKVGSGVKAGDKVAKLSKDGHLYIEIRDAKNPKKTIDPLKYFRHQTTDK